MTRFLLAGGGTAGHVNPMLALADEMRRDNPNHEILTLGTAEGLEARLVPARGYRLETVPKLPFPRKFGLYLFKFPVQFRAAVATTKRLIREHQIEIVIGFGGYASAPAYQAARELKIPLVIHEANALPGIANRMAAKFAAGVAVAFRNTDLPNASFVGMPLRSEIEDIARVRAASGDWRAARKHFGLNPDGVTLLVTGGSLGAQRINSVIEASRALLSAAGIQVLHIVGNNSDLKPLSTKDYVRVNYCDRMELAISAATFAVSRAGSSTVAEFSAVGLPALYIPYPVGNGEQRYNIQELIAAGASSTVSDQNFTPEFVAEQLIPMISDSRALAEMSRKVRQIGIYDGAARMLALVKGVLNNKTSSRKI